MIIIALLGAFALDNKRKRKVTLVALAAALNQPPAPVAKPRRLLGIYWDDEHNPLCPVCEILLHVFYIVTIDGEDENRHQALRCPKCKAEYTLLDDEGQRHGLWDVKAYLNGNNPHEFD